MQSEPSKVFIESACLAFKSFCCLVDRWSSLIAYLNIFWKLTSGSLRCQDNQGIRVSTFDVRAVLAIRHFDHEVSTDVCLQNNIISVGRRRCTIIVVIYDYLRAAVASL